jgi:hypothetical protein
MSAYTVRIVGERDYATLCWLSDRGYDGGFLGVARLERIEGPNGVAIDEPDDMGSDGVRVYSLTEPEAWTVREYVDEDPCAFLACCGSDTLARALLGFLERIV